jgi:hypothetical protein
MLMNWLDRFHRTDGEPRVQVYDSTTEILSTIPARELAPGMMRVKMDGIEGDCWMQQGWRCCPARKQRR